jgi:hypothetical protein
LASARFSAVSAAVLLVGSGESFVLADFKLIGPLGAASLAWIDRQPDAMTRLDPPARTRAALPAVARFARVAKLVALEVSPAQEALVLAALPDAPPSLLAPLEVSVA